SLLLAAAAQADRPEALAIALVREARTHFDAAVLVFVVEQRTRRAAVVAGDPLPTRGDWFGLDEASPLAEALETGTPVRLRTARPSSRAAGSRPARSSWAGRSSPTTTCATRRRPRGRPSQT